MDSSCDEPLLFWLPFFSWMQREGRLVYAAATGVMGLMVGSFLNVAIYRWPRGLNLVAPPSACPRCGRAIRFRDNVPVLGWLLLRGRCRDCGEPISPRYPLVEALHGGLWAAAGWWGWALPRAPAENAGIMLAFLVFIALLTTASFIDWDVGLIPDGATLGGTVFMLAAAASWPWRLLGSRPPTEWAFPAAGPHVEGLLCAFWGMLAGAGVIYAVMALGTWLFRRRIAAIREAAGDPGFDRAVGLGDVKLMLLIGAYLGPRLVLPALVWASFAGGLGGLVLKWFTGRWPPDGRRWTARSVLARFADGASVMALGPYLAFGALVMAFGGENLLNRMWRLVMPA